MGDPVDGWHEILPVLGLDCSASVGIAIKTRKVRVGDFQADAVPCLIVLLYSKKLVPAHPAHRAELIVRPLRLPPY